MWGQEKKVETSSSEQEGKEVAMVAANSTMPKGPETLVPLWERVSNSRARSPIAAR